MASKANAGADPPLRQWLQALINYTDKFHLEEAALWLHKEKYPCMYLCTYEY